MAQDNKPPNTMGDVNNNQGIITQGQVGNNLILQGLSRPFGDAEKAYLLAHVTKQRKIVINVMPDGPAEDLAGRIFEFLKGGDYQVDPVNHFLMAAGPNGPPRGVSINNPPDETKPTVIWVGLP